jgi:hypothetical protein
MKEGLFVFLHPETRITVNNRVVAIAVDRTLDGILANGILGISLISFLVTLKIL